MFWLVFWSLSAWAMVWVYSPGGLGDPDRDLKHPTKRIGEPVCVGGCAAAAEESVADGVPASADRAVGQKRSTSGPKSSQSDKNEISLPTLPTIKLPEVSIDVDEVFMLAGSRYLRYRVAVYANDGSGQMTISANIPTKTWAVECTDQAGQQVCTDTHAGADDGHEITRQKEIAKNGHHTFTYLVRIDQFTGVNEDIVNHAHVSWRGQTVRSVDNVFTVPPLVGS